jgi:hypothetical protein
MMTGWVMKSLFLKYENPWMDGYVKKQTVWRKERDDITARARLDTCPAKLMKNTKLSG